MYIRTTKLKGLCGGGAIGPFSAWGRAAALNAPLDPPVCVVDVCVRDTNTKQTRHEHSRVRVVFVF